MVQYIAATHATKEAMWIRMFLAKIGHLLTQRVTLYCNNQSAISVSKNNQFHVQKKHIVVQHHFFQDVADCRLISIH